MKGEIEKDVDYFVYVGEEKKKNAETEEVKNEQKEEE